jgi:hypothetical protein
MTQLEGEIAGHGGATFGAAGEDYMKWELGGRDQHDFEMGMKYGNDTSKMSAAQLMGRAEADLAYEQDLSGAVVSLFDTGVGATSRMDHRMDGLRDLAASEHLTADQLAEMQELARRQGLDIERVRSEKDMVTDSVATAAGLAALAFVAPWAVGALKGLTASMPALAAWAGTEAGAAAIGALCSGGGSMIGKGVMMGESYAGEDILIDGANTVATAFIGAKTAGAYEDSPLKAGALGGFLDAGTDAAIKAGSGDDVSLTELATGTFAGGIGGVAGHSGGMTGAYFAENQYLQQLLGKRGAKALGAFVGGSAAGAITSEGELGSGQQIFDSLSGGLEGAGGVMAEGRLSDKAGHSKPGDGDMKFDTKVAKETAAKAGKKIKKTAGDLKDIATGNIVGDAD